MTELDKDTRAKLKELKSDLEAGMSENFKITCMDKAIKNINQLLSPPKPFFKEGDEVFVVGHKCSYMGAYKEKSKCGEHLVIVDGEKTAGLWDNCKLATTWTPFTGEVPELPEGARGFNVIYEDDTAGCIHECSMFNKGQWSDVRAYQVVM